MLTLQFLTPVRARSEAAYTSLAGVAPLEASSGQRTRHRLDHGGDRALNRPCTRSRSPASAAPLKPGPTRPGAPLKARPTAISAAASLMDVGWSGAGWQDGCRSCWT
jgi:hypothetical protein